MVYNGETFYNKGRNVMNDNTAAVNSRRKIILSGIQPTGTFTLGNYLGAVKNWRRLQEEYDCYYLSLIHI